MALDRRKRDHLRLQQRQPHGFLNEAKGLRKYQLSGRGGARDFHVEHMWRNGATLGDISERHEIFVRTVIEILISRGVDLSTASQDCESCGFRHAGASHPTPKSFKKKWGQ